jgi:hypothetical protein
VTDYLGTKSWVSVERYLYKWSELKFVQESMVDRFFPTMAPSLYLEEKGMDIVHMFQYCFPFGTDLTLYSMRSVESLFRPRLNLLTRQQQVLHDFIQQIAAMFPEGELRDNYTGAAQNFRIPYWDWAAPQPPGQSAFPDSIGSPWVDAEGPAGVQRIANPLFSYQFQLLNTTELPNLPVSKSDPKRFFF